MFKCQATGVMSRPGEPARKLVTHVRNKTYFRFNTKTNQREPIGYGSEVVREILVSKEYHDSIMADGFAPEVVYSEEE